MCVPCKVLMPSDSFHSTSFHGTRLSFGCQVCISDTVSNRGSIFGVWKGCKVYMSNWLVSSDLDLIFMVQWLQLSFCVLICFSYTVCNRTTIFGVWNGCKVFMSSWYVSSDLDIIFMVQWLQLSFVCWSVFLYCIIAAIGLLYLV